jgi:hypothetical protein
MVVFVGGLGFFAYTRSDSVRLRCLGEKIAGVHQGFPENVVCAFSGG